MIHTDKSVSERPWTARRRAALAAACLLACTGLSAGVTRAQTAPPATSNGGAAVGPAPAAEAVQPVPPVAAPEERGLFGLPPQPPPPADRPGFVYQFGRWWDSARGKSQAVGKPPDDRRPGTAGATPDPMRDAADATRDAANATQDAIKNAAEATREAATALFRLPGIRVMEVRQRCATAPNGAPDCRTAAAAACRAKGFNAGQPVDVRSAQSCPPAVWMSGRQPVAGECPEETVVLMAACQ